MFYVLPKLQVDVISRAHHIKNVNKRGLDLSVRHRKKHNDFYIIIKYIRPTSVSIRSMGPTKDAYTTTQKRRAYVTASARVCA